MWRPRSGDRVVGLLVLMFGQRPGKIARLAGQPDPDRRWHTTPMIGITPVRIRDRHLHELSASAAISLANPGHCCSPVCAEDGAHAVPRLQLSPPARRLQSRVVVYLLLARVLVRRTGLPAGVAETDRRRSS